MCIFFYSATTKILACLFIVTHSLYKIRCKCKTELSHVRLQIQAEVSDDVVLELIASYLRGEIMIYFNVKVCDLNIQVEQNAVQLQNMLKVIVPNILNTK